MFLIAICRQGGDKWQSKTLFLSIFEPFSSFVDYVIDLCLPDVPQKKLKTRGSCTLIGDPIKDVSQSDEIFTPLTLILQIILVLKMSSAFYVCCIYSNAFQKIFDHESKHYNNCPRGAQWLIGRVLDSRPKGRGFEPHRCHCVVVLEQDTFILA